MMRTLSAHDIRSEDNDASLVHHGIYFPCDFGTDPRCRCLWCREQHRHCMLDVEARVCCPASRMPQRVFGQLKTSAHISN